MAGCWRRGVRLRYFRPHQLNTAIAKELEDLPNTGPVLAERIDPTTYEAIRHLVMVGE